MVENVAHPVRALSIQTRMCPVCRASPGQPCVRVNGGARVSVHRARLPEQWRDGSLRVAEALRTQRHDNASRAPGC
jgi:hypothetical protein